MRNTLIDSLLRFIDLELTEPNPPEMEEQEYGYVIFEPLPNITIRNKGTPIPSETVVSIKTSNHDNVMVDQTINICDQPHNENLTLQKKRIPKANCDNFWNSYENNS